MLNSALSAIFHRLPFPAVKAHCDGPCGVYDPASARVAAEAVLSMTKKLLAMTPPSSNDPGAWAEYNNTFSRYVAIKEEQAKETKKEEKDESPKEEKPVEKSAEEETPSKEEKAE